MAEFFEQLNDSLVEFIGEQKIFFTATAPNDGRINLSPKGMDTFRCLNLKTVGFLNLTGSGNETAAHVAENGRMTIMFCSFTRKPLILRIYGKGRAIHPGDEEWHEIDQSFEPIPGARQVVLLDIESVQTSCGYAVPLMEFKEERRTLRQWAENKGENGIRMYRKENNRRSIDGLPTNLPD